MLKAFCITLPEYPDKIEKAKAHFSEHGLTDVECFWGIHAELAGLATSHTYEVDNPGSGFKIGTKCTGIWLAHLTLWNTLSHLNYDRVLVLETDARLHDDFLPKCEQALKDAPSNFDFLHVGHCCAGGWPRTHIAGNVFECKNMQCTHAYIIARKCLPFMLRTIRKCWAPIDIQMVMECFPYLKTYMVWPRIVSQFDTEISD